MSNIDIIDRSRLSFDGINITDAFMTGSIKYRPYFQLAVSTFDEQITLSVAFHGTQADQEKIQNLLKELDKELSFAERTH